MPFILYVYLLLFIKLSLSKINAINQLVVETLKGNNITQEGIYVCIILSQIILKSMISILNIALIYISRLYCAFSNKKNIEY